MELSTNMQAALNAALSERSRLSLLAGGVDAKRQDAYCQYGYPMALTFNHFYKLFEREGVAYGAVTRLVEKCWETDPEVIEGEPEDRSEAPTAWEKQFKRLAKRIKLWETFRKADTMRLVGHYSGVILQIADSKQWNQPVDRVNELALKKLIPAWEGQLTPASWDTNEMSETYGEPTMWLYQETNVQDGDTCSPGRSVEIHPSRVVILGDIRAGVPFLRSGYNAFVNIEKIVGGSGESFLKNASRQLHIGFDVDANLDAIARAHGVLPSELREVFDDVTKGMNQGIDQTIITQGGTVTPLVANVPDPEPHFGVALQIASASVQIPAKILVGNQTGERASTEDINDFNKRGQGRRLNTLSADIELFLAHCTALGILTPIESSVIWSDLTEQTLEDRLANVQKMVDANQKMLGSGEMVFSVDEMRQVAGYEAIAPIEPLADEEPVEIEEEETGL